jgi:cytochrome P450
MLSVIWAAYANMTATARDITTAILTKLTDILTISIFFYVVYTACSTVYQLYWSPLAAVPGRKLWITFPILKHIAALRGRMDLEIRQMHDDHGPIIRLGPREVSFITSQAWTDIYGWGHRQLPKTQRFSKDEVQNIITANDANHTRFRKAISHGFSDKALRDQEQLIKKYIDLLMEKLRDVAEVGTKTDMVKWYNYTTFDLIGDLTFGQSFNCLASAKTHFWVSNVLKFIRSGTILRLGFDYPVLIKVFQLLVPKSVAEARRLQFAWTKDTVLKRINNEDLHGRGDFMDSMLRHKGDKDELSEDELISNSNILVLAGSETTATLLCGVTYYLAKDPRVLKIATDEVRTNFEQEEEITFTAATAKLPYMLACLNEALRRYPPVPTTLTRVTIADGPTTISGINVPPKVRIIFP